MSIELELDPIYIEVTPNDGDTISIVNEQATIAIIGEEILIPSDPTFNSVTVTTDVVVGGDVEVAGDITNVNSVKFDTTPQDVPTTPGTVFYDTEDNVLAVRLPGGITNQISEEVFFAVRNKSQITMLDGKLVYIDGEVGNRSTVAYASNTSCATAARCIAMLTQDIAPNAIGKATFLGLVRGRNTHGLTGEYDLWLGTNGDYTITMPPIGTPRVKIGRVAKIHPTDGHILVFIQHDKYMFGNRDAGNYSLFEDDGTLVAHGDARTFKDMICDVLSLQQSGPGVSFNTAECTVDFTASANLLDFLYANVQLNHDRDLTSPVFPHIHTFQALNALPNYLLEYRWQINGRPKVTAWTRLRFNEVIFAYVNGVLCQVFATPAIVPPVGTGPSDIVQIKFFRDNANASGLFPGLDPINAITSALSFDIHYESNKSGSRAPYED